MEIIPYTPKLKQNCIDLFKSNLPKFFAQDELELFDQYLDRVAEDEYFVVVCDDRILACGGVFFDKNNEVGGLAWGMVHLDYHRKGIGRFFSKYRIEILKRKYPNSLYQIETTQHSAAFYRKMGFVVKDIVVHGFGIDLDKYTMELDSKCSME